MRKNKYFSLSLMWEGIKQTKSIGICLTVITVISACFNPFTSLLNASEASFHAVTINEFVSPIFSMFYFIPTILILGLFGFMNKRNSSDFYHSVPLNRSCVYITYSAVTMIWCIFIILVSTFSSYLLYILVPSIMITPYFIWITLYSSFIAAFLVMSIALVAVGLSGNLFSDIVTFLLLMFAPRLIISLFVSAISSAVPIVSVDSMPLLRPYINILFIPFQSISYAELLTDWGIMLYSFILAVVYFVGGFFIHRARKSESAESAVAFKGVRHVIRSLIGIVPTLMICYPLSLNITLEDSKQRLNVGVLILGVGISVIAYFIYEFIATRSVKKLLYAVPLYLIVVAFDFAFIFGSQAIDNSILNTVPVQSDIQSISVKPVNDNYNHNYGLKIYQECKTKTFDYENKELIKIFSDNLYNNVKSLKNGGSLYSGVYGYYYYSAYQIEFHCKDGQNITRKVYIPNNGNTDNWEETVDGKIYKLMKEDKSFADFDTMFPENDEVKKVYITNDVGAVYSSQFTNEEIQKVWQTFRNEYVSLLNEDKNKDSKYNFFEDMSGMSYFHIYLKGYAGVDAFYDEYIISQNFTPRTYKIVVEILSKYQKPLSSDVADIILSGINENHYFEISVETVNNRTGGNSMFYDPEMVTNLDKKDFDNFAKAVKILTDAAQKDCDMSKDNVYLVSFNLDVEEMPVQRFQDVDGGSYSASQFECFVNLTDEEYNKYCSIYDDFEEKNQDTSVYSE